MPVTKEINQSNDSVKETQELPQSDQKYEDVKTQQISCDSFAMNNAPHQATKSNSKFDNDMEQLNVKQLKLNTRTSDQSKTLTPYKHGSVKDLKSSDMPQINYQKYRDGSGVSSRQELINKDNLFARSNFNSPQGQSLQSIKQLS